MGIDRALFDRLGGFNGQFPSIGAEDIDLCLRSAAFGATPHPITNPQATVTYQPRSGLVAVARQRMSYARGAAHLCATHQLSPASAANSDSWQTVLRTPASLRRALEADATAASFCRTRW